MASKWEKLGGERGQSVDTSRLGRAFKLGKMATRLSILHAQGGDEYEGKEDVT